MSDYAHNFKGTALMILRHYENAILAAKEAAEHKDREEELYQQGRIDCLRSILFHITNQLNIQHMRPAINVMNT